MITTAALDPVHRTRRRPPDVLVVVPVHDEEATLAQSIRRLHRFLEEEFPLTWRIVIADNASGDRTPAIASALARELGGVELLRLERKGRGRALRTAWSALGARVVAYMDVDLSTDLRALLPLVAPLLSGHSDVAIGTRLVRSARVVRGPKREIVSRGYNRLLHVTLRARFSDAQCGFKALRAEAAAALLPAVRDDGWFFDTELLVAAQRRGMRIHEVPVDWVDDPDSRVDVIATAWGDLLGIARLLAAGPIARFAANAVALAVTAVANTAANRRLTFGVHGRAGVVRQCAAGTLVYALTLGLTSGSLAVLHGLAADPPWVFAVPSWVLVESAHARDA